MLVALLKPEISGGRVAYQDLAVVLLDLHLHIETGELGHVPRCVGVLGPEHGANAEDALPAAGDFDLLVELRRLRFAAVSARIPRMQRPA